MILDSSGRQKFKCSLKEIMLEIRNKIHVREKFPGTYKQGRAKKAFLPLKLKMCRLKRLTVVKQLSLTDSWSPTSTQPESKVAF